ncbi:hypothetical protein GCM10027043_48620 [Ferruginibacter profundus]
MYNEKDIITLVLLVINKGAPLNNSFNLVRMLERRFRIIETVFILTKIRTEAFAVYDLVNGIHYYKLTQKGKEFINQQYYTSLINLLKDYPQESEIIKAIFSSFSISIK